ncbi:hypothetical protein TCAP_01280 [Tolypocladium capitatum]|uniref:Uncharacterized protein n=1 Tax=Tolypocladium capitatum TaxID=45235 RepID=A0A2K3QMP6_9HYPO|nr:hypothetical protein TCAP_01280 [Tolypocladium capitatum]
MQLKFIGDDSDDELQDQGVVKQKSDTSSPPRLRDPRQRNRSVCRSRADATANLHNRPFANLRVPCFDDRNGFYDNVVSQHHASWPRIFRVLGASSDVRSFVDDASPADEDAAHARLKLGSRMDHSLRLHSDGMRPSENGIVGDGERGREVDRRLGAAAVDGGED